MCVLPYFDRAKYDMSRSRRTKRNASLRLAICKKRKRLVPHSKPVYVASQKNCLQILAKRSKPLVETVRLGDNALHSKIRTQLDWN